MKRHGFEKFLILFIILLPKVSLAWYSIPSSFNTHKSIAKDAIGVLSQTEYPDIYKFKQDLEDGSTSEDPHIQPIYNGGDVRTWWDDDVNQGTQYLFVNNQF